MNALRNGPIRSWPAIDGLEWNHEPMVRQYVVLVDNFLLPFIPAGQNGYVEQVMPGGLLLVVFHIGHRVILHRSKVIPVEPRLLDEVVVVVGQQRGSTGLLINIEDNGDNPVGVVQVVVNGHVQICRFPISELGRVG